MNASSFSSTLTMAIDHLPPKVTEKLVYASTVPLAAARDLAAVWEVAGEIAGMAMLTPPAYFLTAADVGFATATRRTFFMLKDFAKDELDKLTPRTAEYVTKMLVG